MISLTDLAIPAFFALLILETVVATRRKRVVGDRRDTVASLSMGLGSALIGFAWKGVVFGVYTALHRLSPFDLGFSAWVWVAAVVADDFVYYWFHRLHHEVRLLWASHVPHHSSRRYNLSTALRQSWTPVTSLPFYATLPLLGFDPVMVMTVYSLNLLYQFWIHTELIDRLGPLEWVFNTPSHHRVHHGANPRYLDRNYGGILIVWDRLFGTFEPEGEPVRYGLTHDIGTYNPFRIAFHEFVAIGRDLRHPNPIGTRLRLAFGRPGWRPAVATVVATDDPQSLPTPGLPRCA